MGRLLFITAVSLLFSSPLSSCYSSPECTNWELVDLGIDEYKDLWSIRGSSVDDFWIAGNETLLRCDGISCVPSGIEEGYGFRAIWVSSPDDAWFTAHSGEIYHWNGSTYEFIPLDIQTEDVIFISDLWSSGTGDLWIVGAERDKDKLASISSSIIMHWDGNTWTRLENTPILFLGGIWGFSSNDIWVVGSEGTILHWDGSILSSYSDITDKEIQSVWGSEPNDVWAVGTGGIIQHWDGNEWSEIHSLEAGGARQYIDVWGLASDDIWASGSHFVNFNISEVKDFGGEGCGVSYSIWGSDPDNIWAVGPDGKVLKKK